VVHPRTHEQLGLREDILATLRKLRPHAIVLDSQAALEDIEAVVTRHDNHAHLLRSIYASSDNILAVVEGATRALRG